MTTGIDVVCLVQVMETGRVHPATFRFVREEDGSLKQQGERVSVWWVGFHPEGFAEPAAALRWLEESGIQAQYRAPGFNAAVRCNMAGSYSFALDTLAPYVALHSQAA
jgi:hypothetical protein